MLFSVAIFFAWENKGSVGTGGSTVQLWATADDGTLYDKPAPAVP